MREILPFIIIGLIIVFSFFMIFLNLHNKEKKFREKIKLNSFFNYKENNPTLVKDGYVKCNVCGGSAIVIVYKYAPYDSIPINHMLWLMYVEHVVQHYITQKMIDIVKNRLSLKRNNIKQKLVLRHTCNSLPYNLQN